MAAVTVHLKRLDPGIEPPSYAHPGDAGADLRTTVDVTLAPFERRLVPTGVAIAVPEGYAAFVHPRSGLAARHGLTVVNAPGTVDAGYRGEILVNLLNTDARAAVQLTRGERIAQLVIQPVVRGRGVARLAPFHPLREACHACTTWYRVALVVSLLMTLPVWTRRPSEPCIFQRGPPSCSRR